MSFFEKIIPYFLSKKQIEKTENIPMENIDTIYCFSNTAIGDTLFNTPVFRSLKKHYPEKKIVAVLNPVNYKLFETNQHIDEIMLYSGKTKHFLKFLKQLKQKSPKLILLLHSNDPQATSVSVLSGAQYIIKIPNINNPLNRWHTNIPREGVKQKHGIFNRLEQLKLLGIEENNCTMDLPLKEEWKKEVENYFKANNIKYSKIIALQIGASTLSRMWFNDKWANLAKQLLKIYPDIKIVLTGSPNEEKLTQKVQNLINDPRVINLAGQFSLGGAAALLGKVDLLITPDTGPLHIATALKTPTIGFFVVAHHSGSNACYDKEIHLYIQKEKTCSPCIAKNCKYAKCMLQIEVDEVVKKVKELM